MLTGHVDRVPVTGMFTAAIPAGATVTLRNKSAIEDFLAGTGIDHHAASHASILLQRICLYQL